jgi:3',5'-cyclic AMP phosphodiesterase CpdA
VYALCASLAGPATVTPQDAGVRRAPDANDIRVAFVSDTQTPLPPERLFLRGHRNTEARALLMDAMLEFRPRAVVHLGDLVALGFHESSWAAIDTFMNRLRERRIGFYPVLGNHELMFYPEAGETRFRERFPYACPTGYVRRFGWMAVVLLNSNMQNLGPAAADSQLVWYGQTLRELDADSGIGLVVVGTHHSPFTNSIVVPPATDVQAHFVPPFLRARKARLFLSGHAHAAEHFREGGKDFLVIGGGGGLQQPLLTGGERRWKDHFPRHTATRMFHYLTCAVGKDSAVFTIRMLEQDRTGFVDALRAAFGRASGKSSGELDNSD